MAPRPSPSWFLRLVGLGLFALGLWLAWRAASGQAPSEEFPAVLAGFAAPIPALLGMWAAGAHRLLPWASPNLDGNALWGGALTVAMGLFVMAVSRFDPRDEAFHAPRWVVAAAGLVFVLFGIAALRQALAPPREGETDLTGGLLATGILTLFGVLATFTAIGPGERQFEGGISLPFLSFDFLSGEVTGRIAFGIAALFIDALALFCWAALLSGLLARKRRR